VNIPAKLKELCETRTAYVKILDKKFGVVDETVIPKSIIDSDKPKEKAPKTRRVSSKGKTRLPRLGRIPVGQQPPKRGLGDKVETALTSIGFTSELVEKWMGRPCNCSRRKNKLNQLSAWASRVVSGNSEDATKHLEEMIGEE
tara:strand:+ start:8958 stop:9386 length:429 start_codon:yes stop_codon:yes gene_type:complete